MAIWRFTQDVHTDDPTDMRKMEEIADNIRDYVSAVLLKQYEVSHDKETYGEGLPRWAHIHASTGADCHYATGDMTECEFCHSLACDEMNRPEDHT